jgi:hypothetical protein
MWRQKRICELRVDIGAIWSVLTTFRKPWSSLPKTNPLVRRCIWRYSFQAGVWNCRILNQIVESQLLTTFYDIFHQWLSDIELNQMSAFSASYSKINPRFTTGKRIGVWNCHATRGHRQTNDHLCILSVCVTKIRRGLEDTIRNHFVGTRYKWKGKYWKITVCCPTAGVTFWDTIVSRQGAQFHLISPLSRVTFHFPMTNILLYVFFLTAELIQPQNKYENIGRKRERRELWQRLCFLFMTRRVPC